MKSFETDLKKYSEKVKLKVSERKELREQVLSYMEYHPLPKTSKEGKIMEDVIVSESYVRLRLTSFQMKIAGGVFALVLITIPLLANKAVPGDVLYILKTQVNERIEGGLAISPYKKIEFETKLMERRIAEARILASEGKLTEDTKNQLGETVKEHAQAVRDELTELHDQDGDNAAIAEIVFGSSLEIQSTILGEGEGSAGDVLLDEIRDVVNDAREETTISMNKEQNTPSYEGLIARVESQTTRAYELFESVKETATEEEIVDIERRLSDINRLIEESKVAHEEGVKKSVANLAGVLGQTQKLIAFMTDIDVRDAVELEELVPVVLSEQERINIAKEEVHNIELLSIEITKRTGLLEGDGLVIKVTDGLGDVNGLLIKTTTALELADIDAAEAALLEASAFIADLDLMTESVKELIVEEVTEEDVLPIEPELEDDTNTDGEDEENPEIEGEDENAEETQESVDEDTETITSEEL